MHTHDKETAIHLAKKDRKRKKLLHKREWKLKNLLSIHRIPYDVAMDIKYINIYFVTLTRLEDVSNMDTCPTFGLD